MGTDGGWTMTTKKHKFVIWFNEIISFSINETWF